MEHMPAPNTAATVEQCPQSEPMRKLTRYIRQIYDNVRTGSTSGATKHQNELPCVTAYKFTFPPPSPTSGGDEVREPFPECGRWYTSLDECVRDALHVKTPSSDYPRFIQRYVDIPQPAEMAAQIFMCCVYREIDNLTVSDCQGCKKERAGHFVSHLLDHVAGGKLGTGCQSFWAEKVGEHNDEAFETAVDMNWEVVFNWMFKQYPQLHTFNGHAMHQVLSGDFAGPVEMYKYLEEFSRLVCDVLDHSEKPETDQVFYDWFMNEY